MEDTEKIPGGRDLRFLKPYQTKGLQAVAAKAQAQALARSHSGVPQRRGRRNSGPSRPTGGSAEPEPGGHGRHLAGTRPLRLPSLPRLSAGTSRDGNLQQYKKDTATVELKFPRGFSDLKPHLKLSAVKLKHYCYAVKFSFTLIS